VDPQKVRDALHLVFKEILSLRQEGGSEEELACAKQQLKGGMMLGLESTSNRMMRLARLEMYTRHYVTLDETIAEIDRVTRRDVAEVLEEVLDPKAFSLAALGPLKEDKIEIGGLL
jgi:predicted Zn-dependent peptidase